MTRQGRRARADENACNSRDEQAPTRAYGIPLKMVCGAGMERCVYIRKETNNVTRDRDYSDHAATHYAGGEFLIISTTPPTCSRRSRLTEEHR